MKTIKEVLKTTKAYHLYSSLRVIVQRKDIKHIMFSVIFWVLPIRNNKIVFSSFLGQQYNAQPKMICDELLKKRHLNIDIVWILPNDVAHDSHVRTVPPDTIKALYELYTAKVWVDNCRKPYWVKKKRKQMYIQTWHGPVCLKYVEKDAKAQLPSFYTRSAIQDSKNANYIVSEAKWRTENIKNSFWYNGNIIKGEFKKDNNLREARKRVLSYYSLNDESVKIATYLPTFRKNGETDCYLSEFEDLLSILKETTNEKWIIIVRLHPNVMDRANQFNYSDTVKNGTLYSTVDDLISVSEIIITDYSGCIFEGMRAEKKVLIYAKDYEEYCKKDRGFYFNLEELPCPIAENLVELKAILQEYNWDDYETKRKDFVEILGYYEENAAEKCVHEIIKETNY